VTWTPPDADQVTAYLASTGMTRTAEEISAVLAAETAAQASRLRFPTQADPTVDEDYPADLAEALCRRVAHTLAVRVLPLGLQATLTDGAVTTNVVAGEDAEVRRLERPYRKRVIG